MLEIGRHIDSVHSDDVGETILGVINSVNRNKIRVLDIGSDELVLNVANSYKRLGIIPYISCRVIGYGFIVSEASTAGEDPIIDFGNQNGATQVGKVTFAITGGEKIVEYDHIKYDPLNIMADEVITEASATMVITRGAGADFGVWKTNSIKNIYAQEAAVAGMSSGKIMPYVIVETDAGGKW